MAKHEITTIRPTSNLEQWDNEYKRALVDVIFLSFTDNIIYDYPIPDFHHILKRVLYIMNKFEKNKQIPKTMIDYIRHLCHESYEDYSEIERYIRYNHIFGSEWFYGYGTLYRYRPHVVNDVKSRIEKSIPKDKKRFIKVIQDAIRINFKGVEPFDIYKLIEK